MDTSRHSPGVLLGAFSQFLMAAEVFGLGPSSGFPNGLLIQLTGVGDYLGLQQKPGISSGMFLLLLSPLWAGFIASGLGLLSRKRWSWSLSLGLCKLWGSGNLVWLIFYAGMAAMFHSLPAFARISVAPSLFNAAVPGLWIWYLGRAELRQAFGQ